MTRRTSDPQPFNQERDTGRKGYRHEWEQTDERPLIIYPYPFYSDDTERMAYEAAVEGNPIKADEGAMTYMARISGIVEGKYKKLGLQMPHTRMSHRERDRQLAKLREQAGPQEWDGGTK